MKKVAIHIFPNILRSKGNQTTKYYQLIEYNMRNNFLEKLYTKRGRKPMGTLAAFKVFSCISK